MKTIGTDGRTYIIDPSKNIVSESAESKSALHVKARKIIKKCFPYSKTYEEVILLGCNGIGGKPLRTDFLTPDIRVMIEVQGQQHYRYVKHFHNSKAGFDIYKKNDEIKLEWAKINSISYIALPYDQVKTWENIINDSIG